MNILQSILKLCTIVFKTEWGKFILSYEMLGCVCDHRPSHTQSYAGIGTLQGNIIYETWLYGNQFGEMLYP